MVGWHATRSFRVILPKPREHVKEKINILLTRRRRCCRVGDPGVKNLRETAKEVKRMWKRRVIRQGRSLLVVVPKPLCKELGLGVGDYVTFTLGRHRVMRLEKDERKEEQRKGR